MSLAAAPTTAPRHAGIGSPATADFDAGVLEFADTLRGFIRKRINDPADAADLAQDVFLRVFRARGSLRDPRKLRAWLYQTARGAIVDYYRRRRPREPLPADLEDEAQQFDEVGERLRRSVRRFLATLPEHYRRPLVLADFQGQSVAEIARRLKLSETATKSRLARGRALLRKKLLDCCSFEFDRFGRAIDLRQKEVSTLCPVSSSLMQRTLPRRATARSGGCAC